LHELHAQRVVSGLVVDLGSGSGILARRLTDAGYDVVGVEQSSHMIEIARRAAPAARFVHGSAFDCELPPCVAVTAIGEVLNYRFDERSSWLALKRVFNRVSRSLEPGGLFVFDLSGPGRGGRSGVIESWHDRDDYTMYFRAEEDARRGLLLRDHFVFVREGSRYRRVDERHVLRLFDPDKVTELLRETGFAVRRRRGYPGGPDIPGWHVFMARLK
jgi:SAM-dependent methyltransferase